MHWYNVQAFRTKHKMQAKVGCCCLRTQNGKGREHKERWKVGRTIKLTDGYIGKRKTSCSILCFRFQIQRNPFG